MGFIIFLIFVVFIVGFIVINIKIGNLKYRASQQILRNTGISSSDINAGISENFEKKALQRFLSEHSEYTEDSIKELLKQYTFQIFNRNPIDEFSQEVCKKIQKDSKLNKMQNMEFKRININYYQKPKLLAIVVVTDNKDEYNITLTCKVLEDKIQVESYRIDQGAVLGF